MNTVYLTHLYPKEMSIYGDLGNIISMKDVLEYNGYRVIIQNSSVGDTLPAHTDWYFIGGGADKDQLEVSQDLLLKQNQLLKDVVSGIPLLAICGGYQLLGHEFVAGDGTQLKGIGWFDISTRALDTLVASRCVGNIIVEVSQDIGKGFLVGFENHSGQTTLLSSNTKALGKTLMGNGNNSQDKVEGAIKNNTIGSYLHGPCLAKNPQLLEYFCTIITHKKCKIPIEYSIVQESLLKRFLV